MLCYHGTTPDDLVNILNGGEKSVSTWTISDDDYLYVFRLRDYESKEYTISSAMHQATARSATKNSMNVVVAEFNFPEDIVVKSDGCDFEEAYAVLKTNFARYLNNVYIATNYIAANNVNRVVDLIDHTLLNKRSVDNTLHLRAIRLYSELVGCCDREMFELFLLIKLKICCFLLIFLRFNHKVTE